MENAKTIADVADELGMTYRALRFYEMRGLVKPNRSGTQRLYTPEHIARLKEIQKLTRYGFTLLEIRNGVDYRDLVTRYGELQLEIAEKQQAAIDLGAEIGKGLGNG